MEYSHRPAEVGLQIRSITTLCIILLALFSSGQLRAQNPAYSFATRIGSTGADISNAIAIDANGNLYVTGAFTGSVDFDPGTGTASLTSSGSSDIFVASYDASGSYRWAFRVGSGENEGRSIAVDGSGNVVVTGCVNGVADFDPGTGTANRGTSNVKVTYVAKYNSSGNFLWAFTLPLPTWAVAAVDGNDNIVVSGYFGGSVDFDPGSGRATLTSTKVGNQFTDDIFVARYNASGNYLWAFKVGGTGQERAIAIALDGSGNVHLTGSFNGTVDFNPSSATANLTPVGSSDVFVARYSSSGAYSWAFRAGGSGWDEGRAVAVDGNSNVVVAGNFQGTVDFDPGSGTATLASVSTGDRSDIFVARYSSTGAYLWAFNPTSGAAPAVTMDGSGDIYVTGNFWNGANDFDPGSGTASITGPGGFVARYRSSGAYVWAFSIPGTANGRGIATDGNGGVHVTGIFGSSGSTTVDFDPSEATAMLTTAGDKDIFIAHYTEALQPKRTVGSDIRNGDDGVRMQMMPNPFTSDFAFRFDGGAAPARVEIIDMMGRVVESRDIDGATEIILGGELPAGVYLVRTTQGETRRQEMVRKVR